MAAEDHYHERIARATERLAKLQAKELLATQRRDARAKKQAKRDEMRRKERVADIIFQCGAESLDDNELRALLTRHMTHRRTTNHHAS